MMSDLARDFFSHNPALAGPLIAMALFGLVFLAAAYRAARADKGHVDRMARLALEGDGPSEAAGAADTEMSRG
jgi:hypothetical protein